MNNNPCFTINVLAGPDAGKRFQLEDTCFLGSQEKCAIRLTDPVVDSLHARIMLRGNSFTLIDLSNRSELKINGRLVKSMKLFLGDTISIGQTVLKVEKYAKEPVKQQDDDANPRTEIIFVPERSQRDTLETLQKPQKVSDQDEQENGFVELVNPPRGEEPSDDVAEPVYEERTVVQELRNQGPSISGQAVVDKMLNEARKAEEKRLWARVIGLLVFLGIVVVCAVIYTVQMLADKREAEKSFNEAARFAEANPGNVAQIIEKYQKVRDQYGDVSPKIRKYLDSELERLVAETSSQEAGLKVLLEQLDKRVSELTAKRAYSEALDVYKSSDVKFRERVLVFRRNTIEELTKKIEETVTAIKDQKSDEQQKLKDANDRIAMDKLGRALHEVSQALIDGDCEKASKILATFIDDKGYSSVKDKLEETLTSVKLLSTIDRMHVLVAVGPGTSEAPAGSTKTGVASVEASVSPIVQVILALRKVDLWEARGQLDKAKDHLLYPTLLERAKVSEEDWNLEKEAVQSFGVMWSIVIGKLVSTTPSLDEGIAQWKDVVRGKDGETVVGLSDTISSFQKKYVKTRFVAKYQKLFDAVKASTSTVAGSAKTEMVVESRGSGIGDGKIIQVDGSTCYVESEKDIAENSGYSVGLFLEKTVFNVVGTNKAGAVRVDVRAVLPIRVLSKKQLTFALPESIKADRPVVGDWVLIDKDLQTGLRIVTAVQRQSPLKIFSDTFEDKLAAQWIHLPAAAKADRGRLLIDRSSGIPDLVRKEEVNADLQLPLDIVCDPLKIEFDLVRKTEGGISVGAGDLEFVIGNTDGKKSGIHVRGSLVRPAVFMRNSSSAPQRVVIIKGKTFAYLSVGKTVVECRVGASVGGSEVRRLLLSSDAKIWMDDLVVTRLPDSGAAGVLAVSADGREVLISRGFQPEWECATRLQPVYISSSTAAGDPKIIASGRIEGFIPLDRMLCSVIEGRVTGDDETVWLASDIPVVREDRTQEDILKNQAVQYPSAICGVVEVGTEGFFTILPDMAETKLFGEGFFCLAKEFIVHPQNEEKVATWAGKEIKCELSKTGEYGDRIKCVPPAGFPVSSIRSNTVLLSRQFLAGNAKVDLHGKMIIPSISSITTKRPFWAVMGGEWKEKPDGILSGWSSRSQLPPMLVAEEGFSGSVQYDFAVRIENEGKPHKDEWAKDLMVQLDFSGGASGLTFAMGAGQAAGGLLVHGRTMGIKKYTKKATNTPEDISFGRFGALGASADVRIETNAEISVSALMPGRNYDVRVRRVGDVVTFYINGKRLGYVRSPDFKGPVELMIGAPGRQLSVGRISAREISPSCKTPATEPVLGEFGYVVLSDAAGILIDSSMVGLVPGGVVSIVSIDKIIEGEKSRTVFLKRVGLATVKEVGPMTALVQRNDTGEPVKKGMKVLRGVQPLSFHFTDARINSIDEGL